MSNEEKYILVSLEDDKAKDLANVISNATSRKILGYLSNKDEISETDISKELKLPLSTIHYNLQQLKKNNLVETKHFIYSEKGKKIELYRVVKKFIVIAPKYTRKSLINSVLPLFLVSAAIAYIIQLSTKVQNNLVEKSSDIAQKSAGAPQAMQETIQQVSIVNNFNYGLWFLIGAWTILIIYIVINLIKKNE